jgi:hypothetical protein
MQQFQQEIRMNVNQPKARSIVGPFVLIAVGVLFLIHNLTGFNIFRVIGRYWPLVLIVLGITKLVEYLRLNKHASG